MDTLAIWLARKQRFIDEAVISANSFKKQHPDINTVLYTPDAITELAPFDRVIRTKYDNTAHHYLNWMRTYTLFFDLDADHLLFFDTDTYICKTLKPALRLLNHFDMCAAHAPGRHTTGTLYPQFDAFVEINIGFLAFRNNEKVKRLFERSLHLYEHQTSIYGNNDQGALRDALLMWDGRLCILPPEYNLRIGMGAQVRGDVRVIHGRVDDYQSVEQRINSNRDIRLVKDDLVRK